MPATHEKYNECHYFISQAVSEYHHPFPFRCNLNAYVQALRSVTFMLQSELSKVQGFRAWYAEEKERMRSYPLLRRFVQGRDIVVHQRMLSSKSQVQAGLFRGRMLKLAFGFDNVEEASEDILSRTERAMIGSLLDKEHSAIGEQLGVQRKWVVDELGADEVISLCDKAWSRVGGVVARAHDLVGTRFEPPPEEIHDIATASVLLESDVDPSLLKKWPW